MRISVNRLVYVSGPMQSDFLGCVRGAMPMFDRVRELGLVPYMPQWGVIAEMVRSMDVEEWLAYDLGVVEHCAAVVRLPGTSPGGDRETTHARQLDIPVFLMPEDESDFRNWAVDRSES